MASLSKEVNFIVTSENKASKGFLKIASDLTGISKGAIGASLAIAGMGVALTAIAIKSAAKFDKKMREVNTLVNLNEKDFKKLGAQILDVSTTVPQDASVLSGGMYQIMSAGITNASEAMQVLGVSVKAATAGLSEADVAADAITTIMTSYGKEAADAAGISDLLFTTVRRGKITFNELAPAIGTVASTAAIAGIKFGVVSAALSTMTRTGLSTDEAVTSLNRAILAIIKPSGEMEKVFRKNKYASGEAALAALGFQGVLQLLDKEAKGSIATMAKFNPNIRALKGVLKLTGAQAEGFAKDIEEMKNSVGATDKAFQEMMKTLNNQVKVLLNKATRQFILLGQEALPYVTQAVKELNEWLDENSETIDWWTTQLGLAVVGLVELVSWIVKTGKELVSFSLALYEVHKAVLGFEHTIGGETKKLEGFSGGFAEVATAASKAGISIKKDFGGGVKEAAGGGSEAMKDAGKEIEKSMKNLAEANTDSVNEILDIQQKYSSSVREIKTEVSELTNEFLENISVITANISDVETGLLGIDTKRNEAAANRKKEIAEQLAKQKELINALNEELILKREAQREEEDIVKKQDLGEEAVKIRTRLNDELAAFDKFKEERVLLSEEIKEIEEFNALSILEQQMQLIGEQAAAEEAAIKEEETRLKTELKTLETELAARELVHQESLKRIDDQRIKDLAAFKLYLELRKEAWQRHINDMELSAGVAPASSVMTPEEGGAKNISQSSVNNININLGGVSVRSDEDREALVEGLSHTLAEKLSLNRQGVATE